MSRHLILGGARSGKSRFAEQLAIDSGLPVTVVATAEALDEEMAARIARHRSDRPGHWRTIEAPRQLADVLRATCSEGSCVVVDCLTLWLANTLTDGEAAPTLSAIEERPAARIEQDALFALLPSLPGEIILVANEVGMGLVPESPLGRLFRDEAGRLNQRVAALCERVSFVAAGLPLHLK
ncbi:MAG TPA: bifunctional adenosylcobinamide kinase/adenosylcobinamide-phosphate guanylyltransferase [Azoarcus taiwanensis]|nr:bifunctional adenosylcobinamide kinase/adenosylcobinamide-phosphate guanylyltransferase [Azoarcus taiwanensis]